MAAIAEPRPPAARRRPWSVELDRRHTAASAVPAQTSVQPPTRSWIVRRATGEDVAGIVSAVQELLLGLGGTPPVAGALKTRHAS